MHVHYLMLYIVFNHPLPLMLVHLNSLSKHKLKVLNSLQFHSDTVPKDETERWQNKLYAHVRLKTLPLKLCAVNCDGLCAP